MKQLLYFLVGFSLSVVFGLHFVHADDCVDLTAFNANREAYFSSFTNLVECVDVGYHADQSSLLSAIDSASDPMYGGTASCSFILGIGVCTQVVKFGTEYHAWYGSYGAGVVCSADRDNDGLPDDCDAYPDDSSPYQVKRLSYQKDSNGAVVRECYYTDRGDSLFVCVGADYNDQAQDVLSVGSPWQSADSLCSEDGGLKNPSPGDVPDDDVVIGDGVPDSGSDTGLTPGESADGLDPVDLTKVINNTAATADNVARLADYLRTQNVDLSQIRASLGTIQGQLSTIDSHVLAVKSAVDGVSSKVDVTNSKLDTANDKLDGIGQGVSEVKTGIDTANTKLTGIEMGVGDVKTGIDTANTKLTGIGSGVGDVKTGVDTANTKLTGIGTGIDSVISNTNLTNQNLSIISDHLSLSNGHLSNINDGIAALPTAEDIGQSVKDNLIDPSQTIDTTITDNIPTLDKTDTLTSVKIKCSDRYDLFITTLKGSDLFSLPFGIFTGPSGSGSSIQTVNIGKWGSSTDQTATIDYSNYDNIWDILRSVLLLLTSFACFKILVLKKG
ncbi:hypothetical protein [Desulfobacter sp.]|uniref:hypothetical protein n=1 Tax=Desulfobacter sp. TaxID=2294 RepID=UPI00257F8E7D|nr:hypothetical protein [Desulfobacter sp.]